MFAIFEDGNRQFQVSTGDQLDIDYRADSQSGDKIAFERVLMANGGGTSAIGQPVIEGAKVEAEVVTPQVKGVKLEIQKIRRRKNSRRHTGHRQKYTSVKITAIDIPGLEMLDQKEETV